MNIGIIADVHGNYNALKSVLKNGRLISLGGIFRIEDNIYRITGYDKERRELEMLSNISQWFSKAKIIHI